MSKLLIYVPTYNGSDRLQLFVQRFQQESKGLESLVHLHINDNASKEQDLSWLHEVNNVTLTVNHENIGAARNINKVFEFNGGYEFTWILGDDDYLMPAALLRLLAFICNPPRPVDLICTNTVTFPIAQKAELLNFFADDTAVIHGGKVKAPPTEVLQLAEFRNLLSPQVDEVLLGSLMLTVFRSSKVRDCSSADFSDGTTLTVTSAYPHCLNFAGSFTKDTPCAYDSFIYTANLWDGGNTWKAQYDIVVGLGLLYVIKKYAEHGLLNPDHEKHLLEHYLRTGGPSLRKIALSDDSAVHCQLAMVEGYLRDRCAAHGLALELAAQ